MSDDKTGQFHALDDMFDTQVMDTASADTQVMDAQVSDGGRADTQVLKTFDGAGDAPTRAMPSVPAEAPTAAMPAAKAAPAPAEASETASDGDAFPRADGGSDGIADLGDVPLQEIAEQAVPGMESAYEPPMWDAPTAQTPTPGAPGVQEPVAATECGHRPVSGTTQGAEPASANPWGDGPIPPLWQASEARSETRPEAAAPTGPSVPTIVFGVIGILVGMVGIVCASGLTYGLFTVQRISVQQMTALFCGALGVLFIAIAVIWGISRAVSNRRRAKAGGTDE